MARSGRTLRPLIPVVRFFFSPRIWSAGSFGIFAIILILFDAVNTLTPTGLLVHLPKPGTYAHADEPWNEPLVVRVDAEREIYFDHRLIALSQLEPLLRRTLALRPDWTVYVDGHPWTTAGDIIHVVDIIGGIGNTKAILVTPSMKQEKPGVFAAPPCEMTRLKDSNLPLPPRERPYAVNPTVVSFVVTERGGVSAVKVRRSSGDAEIDAWAIASVRKWRYSAKPGCGSRVLEKNLSAYYYYW